MDLFILGFLSIDSDSKHIFWFKVILTFNNKYCNTIKIILNKFVIIVYNLFKIKKLLKTSKIFLIVYPEAEFKELEPREHRF